MYLSVYSGHCVSFKYGTNAVAMTAFITIASSIITTLFTHTELTPPPDLLHRLIAYLLRIYFHILGGGMLAPLCQRQLHRFRFPQILITRDKR